MPGTHRSLLLRWQGATCTAATMKTVSGTTRIEQKANVGSLLENSVKMIEGLPIFTYGNKFQMKKKFKNSQVVVTASHWAGGPCEQGSSVTVPPKATTPPPPKAQAPCCEGFVYTSLNTRTQSLSAAECERAESKGKLPLHTQS